MKFVPLALALAVTTPAAAGDLRIVPAHGVVLSQANNRGYYDIVIDDVVVAADAGETLHLQSLRLELYRDGAALETRVLPAAAVVQNTIALSEDDFPGALESQLLDAYGLAGVFGRPVTLANSAMLTPSTALIASGLYFAVNFEPDSIRVTADFREGGSITSTVSVSSYVSPIVYHAPLRGAWTEQSLPTLASHHRLNASTGFAIDFFKRNERGEIFSGDEHNARNFPAFGAPVLAAADGVVVQAIGDEVQDRDAMLPQAGEAPEAAAQRFRQYMFRRLTHDFRRAAAGNIVVIRHEAGGRVEYSAYGHLRTGSLRVRAGQSVHQGEVIAEVGDTGDSTDVHLHFQINSGPDPFTSQSLPVQFADLPPFPDELGRIVVAP